MILPRPLVYLCDVDSTMLDNERIQQDLKDHLERIPFHRSTVPGRPRGAESARHTWSKTVIFSDGDVVFQPRKVEHAGLSDAVDGRVLIYIYKEKMLDNVERRYPAEHCVLVNDKLWILTAAKQFWGERVSTVSRRQGAYAHDPKVISAFPPADVTIERIRDLLDYDLPRLQAAPRLLASSQKVTR